MYLLLNALRMMKCFPPRDANYSRKKLRMYKLSHLTVANHDIVNTVHLTD